MLWRYRLFDIAPLARDAVIEHLADAVLSCRGTIVEALGQLVGADGEPAAPQSGADFADNTVVVDVEGAGDVLGDGARHFSMALTTVKNRAGRHLGVAIVLHDVTHGVQLFQQVQHLASTDELTGLLTRRRFLELAEQELARARRHRLPVSLVLLDLDNFKLVNDVYGHPTGDAVLRAVAAACREELRSFDFFGRFGGDEFCVLLPHDESVEGAQVAERLRAVVAGLSVWCAGVLVRTTVSVGVVGVDAASVETFTDVMDAADQALYAAKHEGRNRICVQTA